MKLTKIIDEMLTIFGRPKKVRRNYKIEGSKCPKCKTVGALKRWYLPQTEFQRANHQRANVGGYECKWCHWDSRE